MSCIMPDFNAVSTAIIPFMQEEEASVLALVPDTGVQTSASKSGNWSDPLTWGGSAPPNSLSTTFSIQPGVTVILDGNFSANWGRVDGVLKASRTIAGSLTLADVLAVNYSGTFDFGTAADPIPAAISTGVNWADTGPLDRVRDPKALGRGLVTLGQMLSDGQMGAMGTITVCGAAKTPYTTMNPGVGFSAGQSIVTLSSVPADWVVGDYVLFPGVKISAPALPSTSEVFTILAINGNSLTLSGALAYDHPGFVTRPDGVKVPIALDIGNLSRNVVFQSLNVSGDPQRGAHIMNMHTDQVSFANCSLLNMGRTDKSKLLNDSELDANGVLIVGTGTNQRARYALHEHRKYNFDTGCETPYTGLVVWNTPGWGLVNHSSHVQMDKCVIYNCYGAGAVCEAGDETGEISNNLIVRCMANHKVGDDVDPYASAGETGNPGTRAYVQDYGFNGDGIWLQVKGPGVKVFGNRIYECAEAAIYAFQFGLKQKVISPNGQGVWTISIAYPELVDFVKYPVLTTTINGMPMYGCDSNTIMTCSEAIYIAGNGSGIHGNTRSQISNVTAYNIWRKGIESAYNKDINFTGNITLGAVPGILDAVQSAGIGMTFGYSGNIGASAVFDIWGFKHGIEFPNIGPNTWNILAGSYLDNRINRYCGSNNSDTLVTVITGTDPAIGYACTGPGGYDLWMDPLGANNVGTAVYKMYNGYFRGSYVYIDTPTYPKSQIFAAKQGFNFHPFVDTPPLPTPPPAFPDGPLTPFQQVAFQPSDKAMTGGQLQAKYGTSLWATTAPADAIVAPGSAGLLLIGAAQPVPPNAPQLPNPWRLLSAELVRNTSYALVFNDGSMNVTEPTPRTLVQGYNPLSVTHNGILFTWWIYCDLQPPTWVVDPNGALPVAQANLGNAYQVRGHLHDDSLDAIGNPSNHEFANLLAFPVQTNPDGSKFLTVTWVIADPAGNQATVSQNVVVT